MAVLPTVRGQMQEAAQREASRRATFRPRSVLQWVGPALMIVFSVAVVVAIALAALVIFRSTGIGSRWPKILDEVEHAHAAFHGVGVLEDQRGRIFEYDALEKLALDQSPAFVELLDDDIM